MLRQRLRGSFEDRIRVLEEIADDTSADCQDRIRGLDVLAKYGLGTVKEVSVDEVRERVRRTVEVIRNELPENLTTHVINLLRDICRARSATRRVARGGRAADRRRSRRPGAGSERGDS